MVKSFRVLSAVVFTRQNAVFPFTKANHTVVLLTEVELIAPVVNVVFLAKVD